MENAYLTYTFHLKDGSEVEVEREAYFGFIFAEGFTLKDGLKIKADQVLFKRYGIEEHFDSCEKFLRFLMEDMEDEEELLENEKYQLLTSKIKKISDIKELKAYYRYYDYKEPDCDEETRVTISFKKFIGNF